MTSENAATADVEAKPEQVDLPRRPPFAGWLGLAMMLAHAPLLVLHFMQQWAKPHYQYMPLVPFAAWYLASRRLETAPAPRPSVFGGAFVSLLGALLLAAATLLVSPATAVIASVVSATGYFLYVGGTPVLRAVYPAILFLLLMEPIPRDRDAPLLAFLQKATVEGSVRVFEWMGGLCNVTGAVVHLPGQTLFVAEACSGIHSLFATFACTMFLMVLTRRGLIHAAAVLTMAFGWVMVANILRVLIVLKFNKPQILELTQGNLHEMLGLGTFAVAMLLTLSTDRLFLVVNPPRDPSQFDPEMTFEDEAPAAPRGLWAALPLAGAFLFLFVASGAAIAYKTRLQASSVVYKFDVLPLGADKLPAQIGDWRRIDYKVVKRTEDDALANHSQLWTYANGPQQAIVSLDYPYPGVHDLQGCYENLGWSISDRAVVDVPVSKAPLGEYVRMKFQKKDIENYILVLYSAFTREGKTAGVGETSQTFAGFRERLFGGRMQAGVYQVQVVMESLVSQSPRQVRNAEELLFEARKALSAPNFKVPE